MRDFGSSNGNADQSKPWTGRTLYISSHRRRCCITPILGSPNCRTTAALTPMAPSFSGAVCRILVVAVLIAATLSSHGTPKTDVPKLLRASTKSTCNDGVLCWLSGGEVRLPGRVRGLPAGLRQLVPDRRRVPQGRPVRAAARPVLLLHRIAGQWNEDHSSASDDLL